MSTGSTIESGQGKRRTLTEGAATAMTGGQALARQLELEGVEHVFGLPGDQLMHALDALYDVPQIEFVTTRHEQATTYMADGYARAGGSPGVAMVVPGVGVYNAGAGLATAYAASSPVLQIAGQIKRDHIGRRTGQLHEIDDQLDLVRPVTKWHRRVLEAESVPGAVRDALAALSAGRSRPAHIEIPPDVFAEERDVALRAVDGGARAADPDPSEIDEAAKLLAGAERPLVFAGGGVVLGDASAELTALAECLQAPVVTTREGKGGIDDRHPLSVGTAWNNRRLHPVIQDADVILAVGTRFARSGALASQPVVHVDVDPDEAGHNFPEARRVVGDAAPALRRLLEVLDGMIPSRPSRANEAQEMRRRVVRELQEVGPQTAIVETLRKHLPDETVVVPDTTTMGYMCHMRFPVYVPRTYLSSSYMGTLGFAFPVSLGAKVARPELPVVAIVGDGGFLFTSSELATAVQHGIDTLTLVFNDDAYGNSNRDQRERFHGREIGTSLHNPDFARYAESFGADGIKLESASELGPALEDAFPIRRPTVMEVPIERMPSPF